MKFLLGVFILALLNTILLQVSDAGWIAITSIAASFFSLISVIVVALINRKVNIVKESIDGLLEQKTKADKALGRIEGIDTAAKEKAIGDARELQSMKEQQLLNQTPPNREVKSEANDVKDEFIKTQKLVEEVPDEVVKKLPPK